MGHYCIVDSTYIGIYGEVTAALSHVVQITGLTYALAMRLRTHNPSPHT
jgi:hypothetical protein